MLVTIIGSTATARTTLAQESNTAPTCTPPSNPSNHMGERASFLSPLVWKTLSENSTFSPPHRPHPIQPNAVSLCRDAWWRVRCDVSQIGDSAIPAVIAIGCVFPPARTVYLVLRFRQIRKIDARRTRASGVWGVPCVPEGCVVFWQ